MENFCLKCHQLLHRLAHCFMCYRPLSFAGREVIVLSTGVSNLFHHQVAAPVYKYLHICCKLKKLNCLFYKLSDNLNLAVKMLACVNQAASMSTEKAAGHHGFGPDSPAWGVTPLSGDSEHYSSLELGKDAENCSRRFLQLSYCLSWPVLMRHICGLKAAILFLTRVSGGL